MQNQSTWTQHTQKKRQTHTQIAKHKWLWFEWSSSIDTLSHIFGMDATVLIINNICFCGRWAIMSPIVIQSKTLCVLNFWFVMRLRTFALWNAFWLVLLKHRKGVLHRCRSKSGIFYSLCPRRVFTIAFLFICLQKWLRHNELCQLSSLLQCNFKSILKHLRNVLSKTPCFSL